MSTEADENDKGDKNLPYVCVHCGTPCALLYRQLSASLSSIKAMNCKNCNQLVDPYVEREWLLVAIDCILLRPEAYRHVLMNSAKGDDTPFETVTLQRAIQLTIASSILHAYLKFETIKTNAILQNGEGDDDFEMPSTNFGWLVLASSSDFFVQWAAIYLYLRYNLGKSKTNSQNDNTTIQKHLPTRIFWALILPTAFQVVSIFVLIWENSKSTRALGSLLVACWQGLAVSLVADSAVTGSGRGAALIGILTLMLCRLAVKQILTQEAACVGFEVDLRLGGSDGSKSLSTLCLT